MVSVLFADLVGFTALAEGRDAEAVRDLLTSYFELARMVIERYGGTVEKFIGDAVMAVWGAPVAHEDDAERAVRASLDLVAAVKGLGPGIQARVGVLTGEAAVTLAARGQGMVAGDLVNTASRLQSVAAPGTVLVGEATQRAAARAIAFEPAGDHALKGKAAPVPAWQALRVVSKRKGVGRTDRLEAPFVGRDAELRLLKDLFHATARERRARLVSITGQAGIGKTRLAWEFLKYVDGVVEGVWWHEGRSPSYGEGVTFWALGEMVRSRAGLLETDDPATTRAKIAETVATYVPDEAERRWIEPALLALLGVGESPAGGRDELFRAWRTFFERLAASGTVGLLFEDLQWADPGLLDFIDHLLEWSRGLPILIITLARPDLLDRRPDWGAGRRNFLALGVEPLDDGSMRELLDGLVPGLPARTVDSIVERADGIPLYAVETIRMLVADGRLREAEHGFEPVGDLGELAVPETLQALIAARLDGLEPGDRALLQDAAVLGQSFTLAGLEAVSGQDRAALDPRLHALGRADLLVEDIDPRSPERGMYQFVQALIREVAYGTLAKRDRRSRHLAAARFFESLGEEELAGALAAHYIAAHQAAPDGPEGEAIAVQARLALTAAADRALALGSPEQALAFLEQALPVVADQRQRALILERAGKAATAAARSDRARTLLRESLGILEGLGDQEGRWRLTVALAQALLADRMLDEAREVVEPELEAARREADPETVARLGQPMARSLLGRDRSVEALALLEEVLAIAERLGLWEVLPEALMSKGSALLLTARPVEGIALIEAARDQAVLHGLATTELRALNGLMAVQALRDPRAALALERSGIDLARRIGRRDLELLLLGNAGEDALRTGEWDWIRVEMTRGLEAELAPTPAAQLQLPMLMVDAIRGVEDVESLVQPIESLGQRTGDFDIESSVYDVRALHALVHGQFEEAWVNWQRQADRSPNNAPYALPKAAHAAVMAGDAATARKLNERFDGLIRSGPAIDAQRNAIEAGIAALEGRPAEAVAGYRQALSGFHDLGLLWDEVVTTIAFVRLVGVDEPEVRRAADDARVILTRLEATAALDLLDASIAVTSVPVAG